MTSSSHPRANALTPIHPGRCPAVGNSSDKEPSMIVFFVLAIAGTLPGAVLLGEMYRRDNPMLGAWAHIWLCLGGIAGAAYGVMHSGV